jgi:glycosyltransferase involved in cell wall biosynthesis
MVLRRRSRHASVVITSYNYGRYLRAAIESALNQTYQDTEVIVVDDGSTDDSATIIAGYGGRIVPVLKQNGGQASALNVGVTVSRGSVLFFLDSDDVLRPTAIEEAVEHFTDAGVAKVHWPLREIDYQGRETGRLMPPGELPEGDLAPCVIQDGPYGYSWPDTSGNAWARRFIEAVFPIPESEYRTSPDLYLSALAPLFGSVRRIAEPQAFYRDHGSNSSGRDSFLERVREGVKRERHCFLTLAAHCGTMGIGVTPEVWRRNCWWHQMEAATEQIVRLVPEGHEFILVDEGQWGIGADLAGRRPIPFLEPTGDLPAGSPDDAVAIREIDRLRYAGTGFIAFGWPCLWWLRHYTGLNEYLRSKFPCVSETDAVVIFDLRT